MQSVSICDVNIDCVTLSQLLKTLDRGVVFTPNVNGVIDFHDDLDLKKCYDQADYLICDSRVLQLFSRLLPQSVPEVIPGSTFFHKFCEYHAANPECKVYLVGSTDISCQKATQKINSRVGRDIVIGYYSPPFDRDITDDEMTRLVNDVTRQGTTTVVVCLGSPKQEKWIISNRHRFPTVKIWMGLGATIDFEAGTVKRAPLWVQNLCLEWFYRFLQEPRRLFSRYFIKGPRILYYFYKQLIKSYSPKK